MGLDMYLSVRKYVSRLEYSEPQKPRQTYEFGELVRITNTSNIVEVGGVTGAYVEVPVYYWRKANAIHKWFVDNYAGGVDDCRPIEIQRHDLLKLVKTLKEVIDNQADAPDILPATNGVFFGGTDYDEWYFDTVKASYEDLDSLHDNLTDEDSWLVYQASW